VHQVFRARLLPDSVVHDVRNDQINRPSAHVSISLVSSTASPIGHDRRDGRT
jgi:hypothetical protein